MNISVLTLFPDLYTSFLETSLIKRAQEQDKAHITLQNLFSYVAPKQRIDAPTFGHSAGMILKPEVIEHAIIDSEQKYGKAIKVFLSPQGKKLTQPRLQDLYERIEKAGHVLFVASRYEGVDARVEEVYADEVISIGDFVVMGGDIPTMLVLEGLLRFVPGVVGRQESVAQDSFSGPFVDHPEYTKPVVWQGKEVPEIVRSGNHAQIEEWRKQQAAQKTVLKHFNWLRSAKLDQQDIQLAQQYIPSHYVALLHNDMKLKDGRTGNTSVTTIDIHDIARSSTTYGVKDFFIVTSLLDQQNLVATMLGFWQESSQGEQYNKQRHNALKHVRVKNDLDEVIQAIEKKEGVPPLIIGTSARDVDMVAPLITYFDQEKVWKSKRPVLFIFGTGYGIDESLLKKCDFMLPPLQGFSSFNHLSVRSAVGIILDKWLGVSRQPL